MPPELPPPSPSRRNILRAAAVIAAVVAVPVAATAPAVAESKTTGPAVSPDSAGSTGPLAFTQPTSTTLQGLTDVEVTAPSGTTAVRFTLGGLAFSEITSLYAKGTGRTPIWRTATDASWFPPGQQVLAAEADTPAGVVRTQMTVTVSPPPSPQAGRTVLNGAWLAAAESELASGVLTGTAPAGCQPGFDESAMTKVVVPGARGRSGPSGTTATARSPSTAGRSPSPLRPRASAPC